MASYLKDKNFIIENYDKVKPFASFLPGIAGVDGIPMWSYYVNRGQAIAGFGVENKDQPIMDFVPANQAYRRTELVGFRTFIKVNGEVHEFFSSLSHDDYQRKMEIKQNGLIIEETNKSIKVTVRVTYFNISHEDYPGLVRKVEVDFNEEMEVEILDGLATIWPYGTNNDATKNMSNLALAWFDVDTINDVHFYKNRSTTQDTSEMGTVEQVHFYASFDDSGNNFPLIYDIDKVFNQNTSLTYAEGFKEKSISDLLKNQVHANKLPCAFTALKGKYKKLVINSIIGKVSDKEILGEKSKQFNGEYISKKHTESIILGEELVSPIKSKTNQPMFDAYMEQNFLDNVLRGGYPLVFKGLDKDIVYHVYSRIHGDMEREYNYFHIEPSFYSQGNGNFRDVNQNRRNDVYFVKEAGLYNIKAFMEMIQLDGNNPLVIKGTTLSFDQDKIDLILKSVKSKQDRVINILSNNFTIGKLLNEIVFNNIELSISNEDFLKEVISYSNQDVSAVYGHGYWIDHWTYNMDLIDNYLNIYPDKLNALMFTDGYRYFESPDIVLPRSEKYVLVDGKVRQFGSLIRSEDKIKALDMNVNETNWAQYKNGEVYKTTLFNKLLTMSAVKLASLDQFGIGIMMESEKPGWNDAMNGLPGIFGSGVSETVELKRVIDLLSKVDLQSIHLPLEIHQFILGLTKQLEINDSNYWNNVQEIKESYRKDIELGVSSELNVLTVGALNKFIELAKEKIDSAIEKALELGNGLIPTFLTYEAKDYSILNKNHYNSNLPLVEVTKWSLRTLPNFLEAPARYMKLIDSDNAKKIHSLVKETAMYDKELGLYVTSESLENETLEIGRARAFTAGWLERESCFMHMEFKYLLGLLKSGLYSEFFEDLKTTLPPYMDPEVYGRSTLENSSFIATSVNPNKDNHGRGFVARLTGTTTEGISMWLLMMQGKKLFTFDNELEFKLEPILTKEFFKSNKVEFKLLGSIDVTYVQTSYKDTFGDDCIKPTMYKLVYIDRTIEVERVLGQNALDIREGRVTSIEVTLG